jgi:hypothetical protein
VPVLGTTKPAIADNMKATEPSMLSHAIHQGKSRNRGRQDPAPRAEIANALETRNRTEPKTSGRQTCLSASEALRLCASAANVLWLKKSVPGNCVAAAIQFLSRGHQAHGRALTWACWRCSSTPVIPGLCACTSWQYDAEVKKIDPTKKVVASAAAPTASTYAGIVPRAKQDAPSTKSQAKAEFRRAGSARTLTPGAGTRGGLGRVTFPHSASSWVRVFAALHDRYASYKVQTEPNCVSALGSPRDARHY